MSRYVSEVKTINAAQTNVWARLSDFSELQTLKDNMPAEMKEKIRQKMNNETQGKVTVSNLQFTADTASFEVQGMPIVIRIIDREEPMKCVKYKAENAPVDATLWVQLIGTAPYETKMKVTVDVDVPFFLKPMIGGKLEKIAEAIADGLTRIPY